MPMLLSLVAAAALAAQSPDAVTVTAYVVSIEKQVLTLSNQPLGPSVAVPAGGDVFVMPAPKDGQPGGTWVAAEPESAGHAPAEASERPRQMRMTMVTGDSKDPLTLTEIQLSAEQARDLKAAAGARLKVTYREVDGKKRADKIERVE